MNNHLETVQTELARYAHPLFAFSARAAGDAVEVLIHCRAQDIPLHTYVFTLRPREIENRQFPWTFQKQLYDCLHDFVIEMFTDNPQRRET